jgi:hypothetical protein
MHKYYCVTWVEKMCQIDKENEGLSGKHTCTMSEHEDISANTIPELLKKICDTYCYDGSYWFIAEDGGFVSFNRHEDDDGNAIGFEKMKSRWACGRDVWLCDYTLNIEYREERNASRSELESAAIASGATYE